jgi:hypothetical protein
MKFRLRTPALASIAIVSGAIVLIGYFIQFPILSGLREIFLSWAVILTAVALAIGALNVISTHWNKVRRGDQESLFSVMLIASFLVTLVVAGFFGLTSSSSIWIFDNILIPVEASLVAVLAVVLIYALARTFFRGFTFYNLIFTITALFVLTASVLLTWGEMPLLGDLRDWISQVWALAGVRAILIGVAMGAIATGLRVLIGADRPYEG